jgi:hypothetical protein
VKLETFTCPGCSAPVGRTGPCEYCGRPCFLLDDRNYAEVLAYAPERYHTTGSGSPPSMWTLSANTWEEYRSTYSGKLLDRALPYLPKDIFGRQRARE